MVLSGQEATDPAIPSCHLPVTRHVWLPSRGEAGPSSLKLQKESRLEVRKCGSSLLCHNMGEMLG